MKLIRNNAPGPIIKFVPLPSFNKVYLYRFKGMKIEDWHAVFIGKDVVFDGAFPVKILLPGRRREKWEEER